jgi:hypothetical protein
MCNKKCPICNSELDDWKDGFGNDPHYFSCRLCGKFSISDLLYLNFDNSMDEIERAKISYYVRKMQRVQKYANLEDEVFEKIRAAPFPKFSEQVDSLIRLVGDSIQYPGNTIDLAYSKHRTLFCSFSQNNFVLIVRYLIDNNLIKALEDAYLFNELDPRGVITLEYAGWEKYDSIQKGLVHYGKAFMAMKFGDSELDYIFNNVFRESVSKTGFILMRLDDDPKAGLIDDRLRVEIRSSDFIIADLSHDNPGAYWEAGYAEGLGKPVIYTCEENKFAEHKTHFDTNHHLTVIWNLNNPVQAGENLKATIRATLPHLAKLKD